MTFRHSNERESGSYPCCERRSPLTVFGPIAMGPACICCCAFLRWNRQATSLFPRSCHLAAWPSHFQLFSGSALARWRYINSIARQSEMLLTGFLPEFQKHHYRIDDAAKKGRAVDRCSGTYSCRPSLITEMPALGSPATSPRRLARKREEFLRQRTFRWDAAWRTPVIQHYRLATWVSERLEALNGSSESNVPSTASGTRQVDRRCR
jgi:hypothetical protein